MAGGAYLLVAVQRPIADLCVSWIRTAAHVLADDAAHVKQGGAPLLQELLRATLAEDVGAGVAQHILLAHVTTPAGMVRCKPWFASNARTPLLCVTDPMTYRWQLTRCPPVRSRFKLFGCKVLGAAGDGLVPSSASDSALPCFGRASGGALGET